MKKLFSIFVGLTLFFSLSFLTVAAEEANKEFVSILFINNTPGSSLILHEFVFNIEGEIIGSNFIGRKWRDLTKSLHLKPGFYGVIKYITSTGEVLMRKQFLVSDKEFVIDM